MNNYNIDYFKKEIIKPEVVKNPKIIKYEKFNINNNNLYQQCKIKRKVEHNNIIISEKKLILGINGLIREKELIEKEFIDKEIYKKNLNNIIYRKFNNINDSMNNDDNNLNKNKNNERKKLKYIESIKLNVNKTNFEYIGNKQKYIYNNNICSVNLKNCIIEYILPIAQKNNIIEIKIFSNLDYNINIKLYVDNNIIPNSNLLWNSNWITINYIDTSIYDSYNKIYIESDDILNIKGIYCSILNDKYILNNNINLSCNLINKINIYKTHKINDFCIGMIYDSLEINSENYIYNILKININDINNLNNVQIDLLFYEFTTQIIDNFYYNKLLNILNYCKKNNIPTIFYDNLDFNNNCDFEKCLVVFDLIVSTCKNNIVKYKELGIKNIFYTNHVINPILYNPIKLNLVNKIGFNLMNYCNDLIDILNGILNNKYNCLVDIYDNNYIFTKASYQIKKLKNNNINIIKLKDLKPSLTNYQIVDYLYKNYKYILNINPKLSNDIINISGCGTNIISINSLDIKNVLGNNVNYLDDNYNFNIENLSNVNIKLYEFIHSKYTLKHLFKKILDYFKINISLDFKICILTNYDVKIDDNIKSAYNIFYDEKFIPISLFDWVLCLFKKDYYYDKLFIKKLILPIEYVDNNITISLDEKGIFKFNHENYDKYTFLINICNLNHSKLFIDNLYNNFSINNIYDDLRLNYFDYTLYLPSILNEKINIVNDFSLKIPIIIVMMNLIGFENLLDCLNNQIYQDFNLYIWNNNMEIVEMLEQIINNKKYNFNIYWYNSSDNINGFGKFVMAKYLILNDIFTHIIFINNYNNYIYDDDVLLKLVNNKKNNLCLYWNDLENINIMITDNKVFLDDGFYYLNKKYISYCDLWFSFFIKKFYNYNIVDILLNIKSCDNILYNSKLNNTSLKNEFLNILKNYNN